MATANRDGRDPMGEWPEGWFRDGTDSADAADGGGSGADRTVSIPSSQHPGGQYQVGQYATDPSGYGAAAQRPAPPGSWPEQPPVSSSGTPYGGSGRYGGGLAAPARSPSRSGGPGLPGGPRWRRWLRPRRIIGVLAVIVALLLVAGVGTYFYLNSKLTRSNILVNFAGRPSPGSGTNWLIAGSDSRQGLTKREERRLSTGNLDSTGPGRSDTIMILHIPAGGGRPLLISIPRDSYVNIPGYGMNKINAAFSFGGPSLLAKTVQANTGLYINHFMDIGFGGFVHVVDAVGGVRMCLDHRLHDRASGLKLSKGCHVLNGAEALAYVRDRHDFATQDLQREQDQRIFLAALLKKLTSPGVMLNPFAALPAASGVVDTLTVDDGTSLYQLFGVAEAMRNPETTTVPIANSNYLTSAGDAVQWNASQAKELFTDLQTGQTVPKTLITGSHQGT
ncbi:MAG TPA: LCP family protein [Streptosporangiaceae bacterium]|nr:LCP family protein [Streptosporangiaceae bacterium]